MAKSSELYYPDASGEFGWRPCLYFARGFCKNGKVCHFLYDDAVAEYKSAKISNSPISSSAKYWNFQLQSQTNGQRRKDSLCSNFCNGNIAAQENLLLRRSLEEQQHAELLQHAIEQQSRRFKLMGMKLSVFLPQFLLMFPV